MRILLLIPLLWASGASAEESGGLDGIANAVQSAVQDAMANIGAQSADDD